MLNTEALVAKLKSVVPSLITSQQTTYAQNRYIGEVGRLTFDILDISDKLTIHGYLVTVDIEKVFNYLDHRFLLVVLKKIGFGNKCTHWIKILLTNQESCITSGSSTTSHFKFKKEHIKVTQFQFIYLSIALEIIFAMIKSNPDTKSLNIFNHSYLYTAYVDDTTFF